MNSPGFNCFSFKYICVVNTNYYASDNKRDLKKAAHANSESFPLESDNQYKSSQSSLPASLVAKQCVTKISYWLIETLPSSFFHFSVVNRELKSHDGNANKKSCLKNVFAFLERLRDYSNGICLNYLGAQLLETIVLCSRSPQSFEFEIGHFTLLPSEDGKEMCQNP